MISSKQKKLQVVSSIASLYSSNEFVFMFNYTGLNSKDFFELRKNLFEKTGDRILVTKNTLHSLALDQDKNHVQLSESLKLFPGQNALIFTNKPISVSVVLSKFVNASKISFSFFSDKKTISKIDDMKKISMYSDELGLKASLVSMMSESYSRVVRILSKQSDKQK